MSTMGDIWECSKLCPTWATQMVRPFIRSRIDVVRDSQLCGRSQLLKALKPTSQAFQLTAPWTAALKLPKQEIPAANFTPTLLLNREQTSETPPYWFGSYESYL